jgi:hypothetical protein
MDIGMFASNWVKPDDVRHEPLVTRIIAVLMNDKLNRPMLELENGMQFTLFERNVDVLIKAWGRNTDDWPGYEVELSYETYSIKKSDGSTEEKEGVKIRPISPRKAAPPDANGGAKPLPPTRQQLRNEMDDSIPFVLTFVVAALLSSSPAVVTPNQNNITHTTMDTTLKKKVASSFVCRHHEHGERANAMADADVQDAGRWGELERRRQLDRRGRRTQGAESSLTEKV